MTLKELAEFLIESYAPLPKRECFIQASRDNIISQTQLKDLLDLYNEPQAPVEEPKPVKKKYNLMELRERFDVWSRKAWKDMSNDELDLLVDSYHGEEKEAALAYLEMRGHK